MSSKSRFCYLIIAILSVVGITCAQPTPTTTSPVSETPAPAVTPAPDPDPTATLTFTPVSDSAPTPTATIQPTLTPAPTATPPENISYSRRTPFVPLDNPVFLTVKQAPYLPDDDLVMGLEWQGQSRAYPARMLRFHHIVNDTVAGRPILVTF